MVNIQSYFLIFFLFIFHKNLGMIRSVNKQRGSGPLLYRAIGLSEGKEIEKQGVKKEKVEGKVSHFVDTLNVFTEYVNRRCEQNAQNIKMEESVLLQKKVVQVELCKFAKSFIKEISSPLSLVRKTLIDLYEEYLDTRSLQEIFEKTYEESLEVLLQKKNFDINRDILDEWYKKLSYNILFIIDFELKNFSKEKVEIRQKKYFWFMEKLKDIFNQNNELVKSLKISILDILKLNQVQQKQTQRLAKAVQVPVDMSFMIRPKQQDLATRYMLAQRGTGYESQQEKSEEQRSGEDSPEQEVKKIDFLEESYTKIFDDPLVGDDVKEGINELKKVLKIFDENDIEVSKLKREYEQAKEDEFENQKIIEELQANVFQLEAQVKSQELGGEYNPVENYKKLEEDIVKIKNNIVRLVEGKEPIAGEDFDKYIPQIIKKLEMNTQKKEAILKKLGQLKI